MFQEDVADVAADAVQDVPDGPIPAAAPAALADVAGTDELAVNEIRAHNQKMGRWKRDATLAIHDDFFLPFVVRLMNRAREPLQLWFYWLEKASQTVVLDGTERRCGPVAQMVWFKAKAVSDQLYALTYLAPWRDLVLEALPEARPAVVDSILMLTIQHHAEFERRVMRIVESWPLKLLWIARSLPHKDCERRRRICAELLNTPNSELHITAVKLKLLFKDQVVEARETGRCALALFTLVHIWSMAIPSNTQRIEGLNNMVVAATKLAPSIRLPLLSSRVCTRIHVLPGYDLNAAPKYSSIAAIVDRTLQTAVDFFCEADNVLGTPGRWATPAPSVRQKMPLRFIDPAQRPTTAQVWATRYNAQWARAIRDRTKGWYLRGLLNIRGPGNERPQIWACALLHQYQGLLLACDIDRVRVGDGFIVSVSLRRPFAYKSSLDVFASLFDSRLDARPFELGAAAWSSSPICDGEFRNAVVEWLGELGTLGPWEQNAVRRRDAAAAPRVLLDRPGDELGGPEAEGGMQQDTPPSPPCFFRSGAIENKQQGYPGF